MYQQLNSRHIINYKFRHVVIKVKSTINHFKRIFIHQTVLQSTPVISCQLGAKIRERELSGSPVISRFRVKAQTRDFQDQSPTLWRLHLLNPNSMLNDNGCTYISWISADVSISNKSQQAILYFDNFASKTVKLHVA